MLKRVISEYSKQEPYPLIKEYNFDCLLADMVPLFDVDDDVDMTYVYPIRSEAQVEFFQSLGVPIDTKKSFWYIESYEE